MNFKQYFIFFILFNYGKTNGLPNASGEGAKCVLKCCEDNHHLNSSSICVKDSNEKNMDILDFSEVFIYKENLERTDKILKRDDLCYVKPHDSQEESTLDDIKFQPYLLENGKLHIKIVVPNAAYPPKLVERESFCVDYRKDDEEYEIAFRYHITIPDTSIKMTLNTIALIISSIFLVLVLIVYSVLGSLRNLSGKITMSVTASLLGSYVMLLALSIKLRGNNITLNFCLLGNYFFYFFMLASFFWMNIYSYDIWRKCRSLSSGRSKEARREDLRRFIVYSIYSWGTPVVMAIILICIDQDHIDVRNMPAFIKPNILINRCFFGYVEKLYYIYIPMLILIGFNWIFFIRSAYLVWKIKRPTRNMQMSTPNGFKQQLSIFIRMSLVMGITWVFEVVSSFTADSPAWYVVDLYNICTGIGLFIITVVCNSEFHKAYKKRFKNGVFLLSGLTYSSGRGTQTQETTMSIDDRPNEMQLRIVNEYPQPMNNTSKEV